MDSRIPCEREFPYRVRSVKGGIDRLQLVIQFDWNRGVFLDLSYSAVTISIFTCVTYLTLFFKSLYTFVVKYLKESL